MRRDKGVISIFLALIFSMLFTFFCVTIDITRINSAKNHLIVAADAAITSVLSNFDKDLYESYGIMTFDKDEVDEDSVKATIDANVTDNSLLNIKVDEVEVEAGGSPFTNNDIMKKQMIHSMKYQGTENLALSVFEKLKNIFNVKDMAKDHDIIKNIEESDEKKELDEKIAIVQQARLDAHKAVFELGKNTTFKNLIGPNMGYIYNSISEEMLTKLKNNSTAFTYAMKALENDEEYNTSSYLHNGYSYKYAKMILEMYYEYAVVVHNNINKDESSDNTENNEESSNNEQIKTPKPDVISAKISAIDRIYQKHTIDNIDALSKKLQNLQERTEHKFIIIPKGKYGIKQAIIEVEDLINNNEKYLKIIEQYNEVETEEVKVSVEEDIKSYKDDLLNINKLKNLRDDLKKVDAQVDKVVSNLKDLDNMTNLFVSEGKKIAKEYLQSNKNESMFTLLDETIGDIISNTKAEELVKQISRNKEIMKNSTIAKIVEENMYQVDTLGNLSVSSSMKMDPGHKNSNTFKNFVNSFKKILDENGKDSSISAVIDRHIEARGTNYTIEKKDLPSNSPKESSSESLFKGLGDISSDDIKQLDNFGDMLLLADKNVGGLLDNAYLVEYVMTNFKDMIGEENENRIPQAITAEDEHKYNTKLGFEIEAIISGNYNDKASSDAMVDELLIKRTGLNFISLANKRYQPEINQFITRTSGIISAATQGVLPRPIVKYALIGGWSALEARYDVIDLLNGKKTPILKNNYWITDFGLDLLSLENITDADELESTIKNIDLENVNPDKKNPDANAYNEQDIDLSLDYIDFVRLRLLTMDKDKLIDRCQDLIAANKNIKNYENYSTDLELTINKSNVNLIFNTPTFSDNGGVNKFNSFSFKRGYN